MNCCCNQQSDLSLLESVLSEYKDIKGSLITILQKAQDIYGYLPTDVIYHVAKETGNTPAKVMGVATFYTQFRLKPIGKYLIMLCQGTACHVNGSERIEAAISEELGIKDGETTEDGLFTLKCVACLGCCSLSPVMMINDETYGSLTPEKAIAILKELRMKAGEE
ncbi:MAG: NADH-quinone oxidoreductase subunit NuoE [Ruminococcus sp.]|nr:NADH-quinone oxidoreductase subunit NuoE [Ruminococcus sp.]